MRLTLLALIGAVCIALSFAQPLDNNNKEKHIDLLQVADQGDAHANEGNREARHWGGGGWGGGGWGGGGWGHHHGWGGGGWGWGR